MDLQLSQTSQGDTVGPLIQLSDFANILAVDVLPVPLGPVKRYA